MRIIHYSELGPTKGVKYSREHLMRKVKLGEFPAPIELSTKRVAWVEAEIDAWIEAAVAKRDAAEPPRRGRPRKAAGQPHAT